MLSSQLSTSTSRTSISSTEGETLFNNYRLPEKYRESCVYARKVFININEENYVELLITDNFELVECQQGEIVNYLNLSDEIPNGLKVSIESFDVLLCDDDRVLYAVKFDSTLIGIERKSSQLLVVSKEKNVEVVKKYFCNNKQEIGFLITFNDRRQKFTQFLDEEYENFTNNETFLEIYKNVKHKRESVQVHVEKLSKEIQVLHLKQIPEVPKNLLSDDPNEKAPLLRYGSIWTRCLAEKLIIGIPIFCYTKK